MEKKWTSTLTSTLKTITPSRVYLILNMNGTPLKAIPLILRALHYIATTLITKLTSYTPIRIGGHVVKVISAKRIILSVENLSPWTRRKDASLFVFSFNIFELI
jgi:hypothetical protein